MFKLSKRSKDLSGEVFGRLTAIEPVGKNAHGAVLWRCVCSCGVQRHVSAASLGAGNSKSCGCYQRDRAREANSKGFNAIRCMGDYTEVLLTGRKGNVTGVVLLDNDDVTKVSFCRWHLGKDGDAVHGVGKATVYMHRVVMRDRLKPGLCVDHIYGNRLDNRKSRLRVVTSDENKMNRVSIRAKSGYKGVYRNGKKWSASIKMYKCRHYLGTFDTPEQAARAYNAKAVELCGDLVMLNDVQDDDVC